MELDYVQGKSSKILNITQELNEQDFFTVAKLDCIGTSYLVVLDFDDRSLIVNFY
jgi:hypothetical protein